MRKLIYLFIGMVIISLVDLSMVFSNQEDMKYVVLVKFREGTVPEDVLGQIGLSSYKIEKLHSRKAAITRYFKSNNLTKNEHGYYLFEGKEYLTLADIPEELVFAKAYAEMSSIEKGSYRIYKVIYENQIEINYLLKQLNNDENVEYAEQDQVVSIS